MLNLPERWSLKLHHVPSITSNREIQKRAIPYRGMAHSGTSTPPTVLWNMRMHVSACVRAWVTTCVMPQVDTRSAKRRPTTEKCASRSACRQARSNPPKKVCLCFLIGRKTFLRRGWTHLDYWCIGGVVVLAELWLNFQWIFLNKNLCVRLSMRTSYVQFKPCTLRNTLKRAGATGRYALTCDARHTKKNVSHRRQLWK